MSPEEIEERILAIDWDELFSDPPDRLQRTWRRKQDDRASFLPLEFGFTRRAALTSRGLIAGQKLGFAFPDPELSTAGYQGFDDLAYPFRAVATDLHTGEVVVLDRGNLLQAVRASMSIPGVFPPVHREGRQLIDGGVINNLPVDIARAMGAEIVIAVDVGNIPEETSDDLLGSIGGILTQTLNIQARHNVLPQMADADVVIQVPLAGIAFKDFKRVRDTIEPGEEAARAQAGSLREYAVSEEDYAAHLAQHRLPRIWMPIVDRIVLENTSPAWDEAVLRLISQQTGQPLDLERLKLDLSAIYDFGVFELVDYAISEQQGATVLTITATGSSYAPHVFLVGFGYSGGQEGKSDVAARLRYSWMEMNRYGGEWRTDVYAGRVSILATDFHQPLGWSRTFFLAAGGRTQYSAIEYSDAVARRGEYHLTDHAAVGAAGLRLGKWGQVRGGAEYGFAKTRDESGLGLEEFEGWRGGYTGFFGVDLVDEVVFPTRGLDGALDAFWGREEFGSHLHYERYEGRLRAVTTRRGHTLSLGLQGGTDLDSGMPQYEEFALGGLHRLSGFLDRELPGRTYGVASLDWRHEIYESPGLFSPTYLAGVGLEAGNAWPNRGAARLDDLRYCLNLSLMARTAIGPVILAFGWAEGGHETIYLKMGSYSLPNP